MSDQQDLSIFDPEAPQGTQQNTANPNFPIVRRSGYDKEAVDAYLSSHAAQTGSPRPTSRQPVTRANASEHR